MVPKTMPDGLYPDDWYMGKVSLPGNIYKVDTTSTSTHKASLVGDIQYNYNRDFDGTNLMLSPNEDYLMFIDKGSGILWYFKLF